MNPTTQFETRMVSVEIGKCRYDKRRENMVKLSYGWCYLKGNPSTYFTASGGIWNRTRTDFKTCGQCLDTIGKYKGGNALYRKVKAMHEKWHCHNWTEIPQEVRSEIDALIQEGIDRGGRLHIYA